MTAFVVTGSRGRIGRRVMAAFPDATGIDIAEGAHIRADLATADLGAGPVHAALSRARVVLHLAAEPSPEAPPEAHLAGALMTSRLVEACARIRVPRLVLASSLWADPQPPMVLNAYGQSKRMAEALAAIYDAMPGYTACAIRFGWVPASEDEVARAPDWLRAIHWPEARLIGEVQQALYPGIRAN